MSETLFMRTSVFPAALKVILESPNILKVGVGIQGMPGSPDIVPRLTRVAGDAQKLVRDYGVSLCNCLDLASLALTIDILPWEIELPPPKPEDEAAAAAAAAAALPLPSDLPQQSPGNGKKPNRERTRKPRDPNGPKPISTPGLARLVGHYVQLHLQKPKKIQRSDWEQPLGAEQVDCESFPPRLTRAA